MSSALPFTERWDDHKFYCGFSESVLDHHICGKETSSLAMRSNDAWCKLKFWRHKIDSVDNTKMHQLVAIYESSHSPTFPSHRSSIPLAPYVFLKKGPYQTIAVKRKWYQPSNSESQKLYFPSRPLMDPVTSHLVNLNHWFRQGAKNHYEKTRSQIFHCSWERI